MEKPSRIAVFASGSGSNAERLIEHFTRSTAGDVVLIVYNRKHAGVVERADRLEIERHYEPKGGYDGEDFLHMLERKGIDLIVLAGYLKLIPNELPIVGPKAQVASVKFVEYTDQDDAPLELNQWDQAETTKTRTQVIIPLCKACMKIGVHSVPRHSRAKEKAIPSAHKEGI